jgi:transposase
VADSERSQDPLASHQDLEGIERPRFLAQIPQDSRALRPHVILDNAAFHLKAQVPDYANTHRIKFYFTPTGASWLNRLECHFTALRKFTLDNTDYRSHDEMQAAIHRYLDWRNGVRAISVENWRPYCRHHNKAA